MGNPTEQRRNTKPGIVPEFVCPLASGSQMKGQAPPAFRLPTPRLSLRVPQAVVDEGWSKAEEKQPILDEMKTKDDKPLKTTPRGRHCDWSEFKNRKGETSTGQIWNQSMK